MSACAKKILQAIPAFDHHLKSLDLWHAGRWPAHWIIHDKKALPPFVAAFRLRFDCAARDTMRLHVSADERYELFLDGELVGRGPERGDPSNFFFDTYEMTIGVGSHVLVARVWALGNYAPFAQMSVKPGFLAAAEGKWHTLLTTGIAPWQGKKLEGVKFHLLQGFNEDKFTGAKETIDGAKFPWGFERGEGDGWTPASANAEATVGIPESAETHRILCPSLISPLIESPIVGSRLRHAERTRRSSFPAAIKKQYHNDSDASAWQQMLEGGAAVAIQPGERRRVLIDLNCYTTAYYRVIISGGRKGSVRFRWAESLFLEPGTACFQPKGNRDEIEGKFFEGPYDEFFPDGGPARCYGPLWLRVGRYLEVICHAASEPLFIEKIKITESRYPLEMESSFACSDPALNALVPILHRTLQMSAHESFTDCPYYEQLSYIGDSALESLVTFATSRDVALPRKALELFASSQRSNGFLAPRYPCRWPQTIPPFSLIWILMLRNYALWQPERSVVVALLPTARRILDAAFSLMRPDGLMGTLPAWAFLDWVPQWKNGVAPAEKNGAGASQNLLLAGVCRAAAWLETFFGEANMALRYERRAKEIGRQAVSRFQNPATGLFSETGRGGSVSDHAQALAILSGSLSATASGNLAKRWKAQPAKAQATIYFSHYVFEAAHVVGDPHFLETRLPLWLGLEKSGFKTAPEMPEPTRSDCHGWSSHPLYHYFATIAGIRPSAPGFSKVAVRPVLGKLEWIKAQMIHPRGCIGIEIEGPTNKRAGMVTLPRGISGMLEINGRQVELSPGENRFGPRRK